MSQDIATRCPGWEVEIKKIRTSGDKISNASMARLGGKSAFVKEIEEELLRGRIDLAVHSLKDLPAELPDRLILGAVTARVDPADVLVARDNSFLDRLQAGARVGTSSLRRRAYLLRRRPDLEVVPLRGNLDTRLQKLDRGEVDAIVVAGAGLVRMGWKERVTQRIPFDIILPAAGQGALAVEAREDNRAASAIAEALDDRDSHTAAKAERSLLSELGGDCRVPVGCWAVREGETLSIRASILSWDGRECVQEELRGPWREAISLGRDLARRLQALGGERLLAECAAKEM